MEFLINKVLDNDDDYDDDDGDAGPGNIFWEPITTECYNSKITPIEHIKRFSYLA